MWQKIKAWLEQRVQSEAIDYLKTQINQALAAQQWPQAEKSLRDLLRLQPQEETAWISLGKVLLRQNTISESYIAMREAVRLNPSHASLILECIEAYEKAGDYEVMRQTLYEAIQEFPNAVELRLYLAQRLFENSKIQEAESELLEILKLQPEHLEANIGIAYCYIGRGRKTQAMAQIEKIQQWDATRAKELLSAVYENVQNFGS